MHLYVLFIERNWLKLCGARVVDNWHNRNHGWNIQKMVFYVISELVPVRSWSLSRECYNHHMPVLSDTSHQTKICICTELSFFVQYYTFLALLKTECVARVKTPYCSMYQSHLILHQLASKFDILARVKYFCFHYSVFHILAASSETNAFEHEQNVYSYHPAHAQSIIRAFTLNSYIL